MEKVVHVELYASIPAYPECFMLMHKTGLDMIKEEAVEVKGMVNLAHGNSLNMGHSTSKCQICNRISAQSYLICLKIFLKIFVKF